MAKGTWTTASADDPIYKEGFQISSRSYSREYAKKTTKMTTRKIDKNARGSASQFFIAGQLCRRGLVAVVTMGNTPNTDILCSNSEGTKFVHIQVKTYVPGSRTVSVGKKAEKDYGRNFIWVLGGIPHADSEEDFEYFIIPSPEVSKNVRESHSHWLSSPSKNGKPRKDSDVRTINLPPHRSHCGWSIEQYKNRWDIIEDLLLA